MPKKVMPPIDQSGAFGLKVFNRASMSEPRKAPAITISKKKRIIMLVFLTLHRGR